MTTANNGHVCLLGVPVLVKGSVQESGDPCNGANPWQATACMKS